MGATVGAGLGEGVGAGVGVGVGTDVGADVGAGVGVDVTTKTKVPSEHAFTVKPFPSFFSSCACNPLQSSAEVG